MYLLALLSEAIIGIMRVPIPRTTYLYTRINVGVACHDSRPCQRSQMTKRVRFHFQVQDIGKALVHCNRVKLHSPRQSKHPLLTVPRRMRV